MVGAPTPLRSAAIAIRPPPSAGSVPVQPKCAFRSRYRSPPSSSLTAWSAPAPPETTGNAQKPCRNILIFGQCKFEGKGCIYNHDLDASGQVRQPAFLCLYLR
jgi:PAB-dependent poly(A)-specific ribonuclease subunit 3